MNDRLQTASSTILTLESKLREMTQADNALQEMLERVREASKVELKRYQEESEEVFHRSVHRSNKTAYLMLEIWKFSQVTIDEY